MNARLRALAVASLLSFVLPWAAPSTHAAGVDYGKDVDVLLDAFEADAGALLKAKGIDWGKVRKEFRAASKKTKTDEEHVRLCWRLIARLRDGHAGFEDVKVKLPEWSARIGGPRVHLGTAGKVVFVRAAFGDAEEAGVRPGDEVTAIDGVPARAWLDARVVTLRDTMGFGTDDHALYTACHFGLGRPVEESIKLSIGGGGAKSIACTGERSLRSIGYVVAPKDAVVVGRQLHARIERPHGKGKATYGWIHLDHVPDDLPSQLDEILAALGAIDGVILDMRANSGGGCDHEAVFGRFVPAATTWRQYKSAGSHPFGGPMVVIVDAGVVSAGETVAGQFKEDGRAYMIGDSHTAGMSAQKKTATVPSGLFTVRYAVASNKGRFNGGKGIEGIGVPPNEVVPYDPKELAAGIDTQVRRALELLDQGFPKGSVAYKPPAR